MVLEETPLEFSTWFAPALAQWLAVISALGVVVLCGAYLWMAMQYGALRGGEILVLRLRDTVVDVLRISPRRVWAIARLAILEAIRRRALVGFGVFIVVLLMGLWFLDGDSIDPAKQYVSTVMSSVNFLALITAVMLSVFSLPSDLRNRTLYTVVTKPVSISEIVIGRTLGFSLVGALLVGICAATSYLFVVRALDHTHTIDPAEMVATASGAAAATQTRLEGRTSYDQHHRHRVHTNPDGSLSTNTEKAHWHRVTAVQRDGKTVYEVGPPEGQFHAREPIYGDFYFIDSQGRRREKGVNVGDTWNYRSYVGGSGGQDAAVWRFSGVTPQRFKDGLRIDLTLQVFRTHKGNIESGVLGVIVLRNPRTGLTSAPRNFLAREFFVDEHFFPRQLTSAAGDPIELFEDLVDEGRIEVLVSCLENGQYFGMGRMDAYLLPSERSFMLNMLKGFLGIWLQMTMITAVGVMWSTFLNGAVAMLATLCTILLGHTHKQIGELASGETEGGGSLESLIRVTQHMNTRTELDDTWSTAVVKYIDHWVQYGLRIVNDVTPDLSRLSDGGRVAHGFDIPLDLLGMQVVMTLGIVVPALLIGIVCLKSREVAR